MKLSPRIALIGTAVGLLLAIVVLAAVLVFPQFGRLSDLGSQMEDADGRLAQAQQLLAIRQQAKENAAATDAGLVKLAAAVPETPDLPSLIIELQDLAYDANVVLRGIEPDDPIASTEYVTVPVQVTVWGDWADCVSFVQESQKLTRQVRVFEVEASGLSESDLSVPTEPLDEYSTEVRVLYHTYVIPSAGATSTAPAAPAQ